ncbi:MAG: hypothetical protein WDM78_24295 [Puia sp.]
MKTPEWANIKYPPIDYQNIIYYSAPKQKINPKNLDEIDPELLRTFEKLGISLDEQKKVNRGCSGCGNRQCFYRNFIQRSVGGNSVSFSVP